ncbi:MAG: MerR family transcriptional regulator [Dehalococcoidia bacterium]
MDQMTIGELATCARVPPRTIRFYEAKRILPMPRRSPSGYRLYGRDDLRRLTLIRRFRALGFSLAEVQQLIHLAEHEGCHSFLGQVAHSMVRKLGEVEEMIERLQRTRQELEASVTSLSQRTGGDCQQTGLEIECPCLGA